MLSRILEYLDQNKVAYSHHAHPDAYTAREVASAEHVPTHEVAKTVAADSVLDHMPIGNWPGQSSVSRLA